MNNMLIGVITSTLSSYPPEVRRGATSGLQLPAPHPAAVSAQGAAASSRPGGAPRDLERGRCQTMVGYLILIVVNSG